MYMSSVSNLTIKFKVQIKGKIILSYQFKLNCKCRIFISNTLRIGIRAIKGSVILFVSKGNKTKMNE